MPVAEETPSRHDLLDDHVVAAMVIDGAGNVREATTAAAELLGVAPAGLNGGRLEDIAADGWGWAVRNALLRLTSGSVDPFELLLRAGNAGNKLIQLVPRRLKRSGSGLEYLMVLHEPAGRATESRPVTTDAELRRLTYGLLRTHDAQRGRIAGALHDDVASLVTMAKFMVEDAVARLEKGATQEARGLLFNTVVCLREALAEVRRISTELRPSSLDDLGLLPTIEWFCRRFSEAYPEIRIELDLQIDEASVSEHHRLDVFRIIEEALINVGRHSRATQVRVALLKAQGRMQLKIEDNGVGFDVATRLRSEGGTVGLGLRSIAKRVEGTHGSLAIDSTARAGTSIAASWPLEEESAGRAQ